VNLIFLGTGGAWGVPELNCQCLICRDMRQRGERRRRTALLLCGSSNLLVDCGPDIASQLSDHCVSRMDALLLTHEHGDHYLGLDELVSYKRSAPKGCFNPISLFVTAKSWEVIGARFGYLEQMGVIKVYIVEPGQSYRVHEFDVFPFKTHHGRFATGSVGYLITVSGRKDGSFRLVYTSDFQGLPVPLPQPLFEPHYLIIQSFWLNEPAKNTPNHMSFQRAMEFIHLLRPQKETFLVHIGDGDPVPGDPANTMAKKREPLDPLKKPHGNQPYPIPRNQEEWQKTIDLITADFSFPYKCTVAYDGLKVTL
jgi:phosphoribosyl 1,2-cyclic phosphate phosphodiesterase